MKPMSKWVSVLSLVAFYAAALDGPAIREAVGALTTPTIGTSVYLACLLVPPLLTALSHSLTGTGGKAKDAAE